MSALRALVEALATIPGRRKAVQYITESVFVDMLDIIDYSGRARTLDEFCRLVPELGVRQSCRPSQYAHAMLVAAHHGNVAFYPVDPRGLLTNYTSLADTRNSLADVTGGVAIVSRNTIAEGLDRIVQDNASHYLIGYNSAYSGRVGRFVNVDVRAKRPGLQVRVRDGYVTPFPEEQTVLDQPRPDASVANALANVISVPAVAMQTFVTAYKGEGSRAAVPVVVEIDASTLALTQVDGRYEGELELRHLATDVRSRVHGERVTRREFCWRQDPTVSCHRIRLCG